MNETKKKTKGGPAHTQKASVIRANVGVGAPESGLATKPVNALALTYEVAMSKAKTSMGEAMQFLTAAVAMKDLTPKQLSQVHDYAGATLDAIEEAKKLARARVLDVVLSTGSPVGSTGASRELVLAPGLVQRVTIQKQGTDPKKFEAALRAKSAPVHKYMDTVTQYKLKDGTGSQDAAIADGIFTADELVLLAHEPTYRVDRTKEKKAGEE